MNTHVPFVYEVSFENGKKKFFFLVFRCDLTFISFFVIIYFPDDSLTGKQHGTMVENGEKHGQNSHSIIHCPTSEGVSEVSERANK